MSLVVKVSVNDGPAIAVLAVQRQLGGGATPDAVNGYVYDVWSRPDTDGHFAAVAAGTVKHRYGDGALSLLRKVCDAADL